MKPLLESGDKSKLDPNFKKKSGGNFKFLDVNTGDAKRYLKENAYCRNYRWYIDKYSNGEIVIDVDKDCLAGYIFVNNEKSKSPGFIMPLTVIKRYRGYGLSDKLVDDAIKKYHGYDLVVFKDNEVALNLYKKHGFVIIGYGNTKNKSDYWMKLRSKLTKDDKIMEESVIEDPFDSVELFEENVVFDRKDLYINMDKFESGKSNIILITGFSGSGKTTLAKQLASKYKCEDYIELDILEWYFDKRIEEENLREHVPACYDFLQSHPKYKNMEEKPRGEDFLNAYREFISYVISWCKKRKPAKFVIEGIQLYETVKKGEKPPYTSEPTILKGTSALKSIYRAMKRNGASVKDLPFFLQWYFSTNSQIDDLYKALKEAYDDEPVDEAVMEDGSPKEFEETPMASAMEKDFEKKKRLNLSSFSVKHLDEATINRYKDQVKLLRHVEASSDICDGFFDMTKLVAYVCCNKEKDGLIWITALEILPEYRGAGLARQLLDYCVKKGATALGVAKDNEIAIHIYESYGFKKSKESIKEVAEGRTNNYRMYLHGNDKPITEEGDPMKDFFGKYGTNEMVAYMEAAIKADKVLLNKIYPIVETCFANKDNIKVYKKLISDFFERNMDKLTTPGPEYLIIFGQKDKANYYSLFGITPEEITECMTKVTKSSGSSSDFKYLHGNPFLALLYYILRYFTIHNDVQSVNATIGIFEIDVYWSMFTKYFPYGVIAPVMNYTIDSLSDKFIIKKAGTIFGALSESGQRSYKMHKENIKKGTDDLCVAFLQRIRNDQNSMLRTIANLYMENHKKGNAIATRNDEYDPDSPVIEASPSISTEIQNEVDKVSAPIITNGVDITLAEAASRMSSISITNLRIYLGKILVTERLEELTNLIEAMIFLYVHTYHKQIKDIKSQYFLYWSATMFKKTNSTDPNIGRINRILNMWGEETGIYKAFKAEGSRINYKKAIFLYIAMSIQKYT
jgi:ribosomal protein S18 acetylase RimI-like enzyme